jgi:pimeloyl-ACP methyl ester carboxylesterase
MLKHIIHNNSSLAYRKQGQGPCLLFLHGFCEDSSMWDDFIIGFEKSYTVLRPDLPGFGISEAYNRISVEEMADALNAILEKEQIENFVFVGHSMGGYVAMAFAEKYAVKLKGLCLFHSHPFADSKEKKQNRRKTIEFMERWGSAVFVKELVPKLFAKSFVQENAEFVSQFSARAENFPQKGIIAATNAMIERPDRSEILKQLKCPVLFIIGKLDEAIPFEISESQVKLRPNDQAYLLPVAHMGMFEAKEDCIGILEMFLSEIQH